MGKDEHFAAGNLAMQRRLNKLHGDMLLDTLQQRRGRPLDAWRSPCGTCVIPIEQNDEALMLQQGVEREYHLMTCNACRQ